MSLRSARNKIGIRNRICSRSVVISPTAASGPSGKVHIHDGGAGYPLPQALLGFGQTVYFPHPVGGVLKFGHQIRFSSGAIRKISGCGASRAGAQVLGRTDGMTRRQ